jgi:hypothetical protein
VAELVEMEPAQPTVQSHGLRRQAPKSTEIFDDRAERGHDTAGAIAKLDRARQVRHPGSTAIFPGSTAKGSRDRFVGSLLKGMAEYRTVLAYIE